MNKVKKLSAVFIMVILITCIATNKTYAALNCNVNLSTPKNKVTYEEQFPVYVAISNLQTTNGIIAIGAVVSYDTYSLTLESIEGQNKWSDPFHNPSNGKITLFKSELSTKAENVFKITFKVKEKGKAKNSAWIKISDFEISDGEEENNCGGSSININIEEQDNTNTEDDNPGNNNTQEPNTKPENNNQNSGNTQTTKPSTGITKPAENGSTNLQDENTNNETTSNNNNNINTNSIKNEVEGNTTNNENKTNNVQNVSKDNKKETRENNKTTNKWILYIIIAIVIIAMIGILFIIEKYKKEK